MAKVNSSIYYNARKSSTIVQELISLLFQTKYSARSVDERSEISEIRFYRRTGKFGTPRSLNVQIKNFTATKISRKHKRVISFATGIVSLFLLFPSEFTEPSYSPFRFLFFSSYRVVPIDDGNSSNFRIESCSIRYLSRPIN